MPSAQPDVSPGSRRRLLLVQFGGDWREADRLLRQTGKETYRNHRYILEALAQMHHEVAETTIMCCRSPERYVARLESGVTAIGLGADPYQDPAAIVEAIRASQPTHLVFLGPMEKVLASCLTMDVRLMCMWADSFSARGVAAFLRRRRLRRQLNRPQIDWVTNHGRSASHWLTEIGVDPSKVFAWDFVHEKNPADYSVKKLPAEPEPRLFLAGMLVASKGTYDAIRAVADLRRRGVAAELRIAGSGEEDQARQLAAELGISESVDVLGLLANDDVQTEMQASTAVLVPSRHDYPEGQPLTITEALYARTPIVASDHPMFSDFLIDGLSAVVFPAGNPLELANAIQRLHSDAELYSRLSQRAPATWAAMEVEAKWGELLMRWVRGSAEDQLWLAQQPTTLAQNS